MGHTRRVRSPKREQPFFRIECAWCKRRIGRKPKDVSVPGETTYGICQPCFADMVRTLQQMHASRDKAPLDAADGSG